MELDELKKSWNKLNEHLEQKNLIDEQALANLIAQYKLNTNEKINKIIGWQKLSVILAGIGIILILISCLIIIPLLDLSAEAMQKSYLECLFLGLILVLGGGWDLITYLWIKRTDIETLPVVKVIERINRFRHWMRYEIIALVVTFIALSGMIYYLDDIYEKSITEQIIFFAFCISVSAAITYYLYKKMIFENLQDIKKNLEELRELKNG